MTRSEILDKLRALMKTSSREKVDWNTIGEDAQINALGFDSLVILDLMYDIQQTFGLAFDAEELVNIKTVGDLVGFLEKKLSRN